MPVETQSMTLQVSTEVFDVPRSWKQSIQEYLLDHNLRCNKATPLQGGASAYIWKIDGLTTINDCGSNPKHSIPANETLIMKYGDNTIKGVATMEVEQDRMKYEARAMESDVVANASIQKPSVGVPRLMIRTDDAVIMSWNGDIDLRSAYINDETLDAADVGNRLGRWTAFMHLAGIDNPSVKDWTNPTGAMVEVQELGNLQNQLSNAPGFSTKDIDRAMDIYRNTAGIRTLTSWDFRPMNTLLRPSDRPGQPLITIVDWEVCSYADPSFDIRIWAAEAMVMESQHGSKGHLLRSFLTAYRQHAGARIVNEAFVRKVAVLVGSFLLLMMPASIWDCTEDDTEPWKGTAFDYIKAGIDNDRTWLLNSKLGPLLGAS